MKQSRPDGTASVADVLHDPETAVEELVDALTSASGGRPPDELSTTVAAALAAVADEAQPVCEFPT